MPAVLPLDAASSAHGGKAATIGRLLRAGLPVPDGYVVPAGVPERDLPEAVAAGLDRLDRPGPVAVRSSAADEDGARASAAGQYDTVLGVVGTADVVRAVATCRASAAGPRATAYRAATAGAGGGGADGSGVEVAVLVQRLVGARAAGVLFTGAGRTVVEASWGLGESVVQGAVDPDRFTVTGGRVVERRTGDKRTRVDRSAAGTTTRDVPPADRARPSLDDDAVLRLAALGERAASLLGGPQDVEWAVDHDGAVWLLQSRPVTADLPSDRAHDDRPGALRGTGASGGRATGPARVVRGPDDFGTVRPGDVLVCRETDPAWTPLFGVAAAVVTETGGLLSHAAIVARELRLPAVLGVAAATDVLRDAGTVAVDGDAGTVTPT
ncbi:PEP/pyruvate-binding domain-containing protein [Krasilnikoviella flava]|uniref:Pyruvate, water dikinase n=1 Tax=Krasilnikoviella flava TaxID=526729 RepID=A0A1T5K6Y5_9MICO|nr:PEP/pyruvate-binding domain-containing protein [Krasilnikoviella flava]SKC59285.1 pyruvate, water dikinase [Krasilnikoviella flava]